MNQTLRILIVDDDQRMTRTLADILSLNGYETVEANSGLQALELLGSKSFDAVLTDVRMPDMNGVEFHEQLRQLQPGLPVVLMTAYASDEIIQRGLETGVVGVFDKPLNINHLLAFFASLARNRIIAIVDDDPSFCKTLGDILTQRGFGVSQITDPHSDVDAMARASQVILLDMKLNGISGLDVLKDIRAHYPSLPVLLVTGYRREMADVVQAALEINAYACLYKPLEIPDLLEKLTQIQLERLRNALSGQ
ncbi:MAG: response regulator [Anaerolineaceae bacterium]|nr:MAG: response regulator [Anaerolineaceae bacterium]